MKTFTSLIIKTVAAFAGFWCLSMIAINLSAQTTTVRVNYGTGGAGGGDLDYTFPALAGSTNTSAQAWGGGGGGGNSYARSCRSGAGGGAGGGYASGTFGTMNATLAIRVGYGGGAGSSFGSGSGGAAGSYSKVTYGSAYVQANGGGAGNGVSCNLGAGGHPASGSTSPGSGTTSGVTSPSTANGTNGGNGDTPSGNAYGGAGGNAGNVAGGGGTGAPKTANDSHGSDGGYPGGGGSGGASYNAGLSDDNGWGGKGGNGKVIITFSYTAITATPSIADNSVRYLPYGGSIDLNVVSPPSTASYQWYKNGSQITGATSSSYIATTEGVYTVRARNAMPETISFPGAASVEFVANNDGSSISSTTLTVGSINEFGAQSASVTVIPLPAASGICVWSPDFPNTGTMTDLEQTDWNNPNNWIYGDVPDQSEWAYIPSYNLITGEPIHYFPFLKSTDNAACERIYLMQGAEVGNPQYLKYSEAAYCQYNLGLSDPAHPQVLATKAELLDLVNNFTQSMTYDHLKFSAAMSQGNQLSRGNWNLLTAPMQGIVSGDYAFGGVPRTFMRKLDTNLSETGSTFSGSWTEYYTSNVEPLAAAEGFAFWINDYQDQLLYRETETGLNESAMGVSGRTVGISQTNGIMEFPYHDPDYVLQFGQQQLAHRTHLAGAAGSDQSTFYYYYITNLTLAPEHDVFLRSNPEYFIFDSANGQGNGTGIVARTITRGTESGIALIGNPFPATIDFDRFIADNPGKIKNGYTAWMGDSFDSYSSVVAGTTTGLSQYIAPGQGFLVELANGVNSADLSFNPATLSVRRTRSVIPTETSPGVLTIEAGNIEGNRHTFIVQNEKGQTTLSDWDMSKIITSFSLIPEVYTLKNQEEGKALGVVNNVIPEDSEMLIPIGIATTASGDIRLKLSGMNNFDADLIFIDMQMSYGSKITGLITFDYDAHYTPAKNDKDETLACENRFYLLILNSTNDLQSIDKSDWTVGAIRENSNIRFYSNYPMQSISVYDLQGRLVAEKMNINSTVDFIQSIKSQMYIAKVVTDRGVKYLKVIR
jgi:hypothetical protein